MKARIAIIAGSGRFPFHVADEARRQGHQVVAFGIQGWVDSKLAAHVDAYEEIGVGAIGHLMERLKSQDVRQVVMAGKVTKDVLLDSRTSFDAQTQALLQGLKDWSVPALLGAVGERLAGEGIVLMDSSKFLERNVCPEGVLTLRMPTAREREDVELGHRAARAIASLDIGQTVVVKERVIVAVEALEGTDAAIRRAYTLAGSGLVVVKTASPDQDRRFDLPIVGTDTIAVARENGVSCLAVEALSTLLLDREAFLSDADAAGICVMGVKPVSSSSQ